jgi:superfamily II DNA or RNA helicase
VAGDGAEVSMTYEEIIEARSMAATFAGIDPPPLGDYLFPFQADLVRWALRRGRAAIFADTGLGKSRMQLEWARAVSAHGRVLILAPLAVADQTVREGAAIGVEAVYARTDTGAPITVTNYEMAEHFDAAAFVGVVLDESSILKSFNGSTRNLLIERFAQTPYRLACTATPAPNDFTELGNHSEFLGALSRVEMLSEFFVHDGGSTQDWRLKGHAVSAFWEWVASWGAVVRTPAALGYPDDAYRLPPLRLHDHVLRVDHTEAWAAGALFVADARSLNEQRAVRRATEDKRVATIARLVAAEPDEPWLVWCELNSEADAIEAAIPGAVQVKGSDDPETKRDRLLGFAAGSIRVLVSKASICGFGMNFQRCARMAFVGPSHSYEQTYQAIRRCWRFGQTRAVDVHVVCAENEQAIVQNMRRKEADAERLAEETQRHIGPAMRAAIGATERRWNPYNPTTRMEVPQWLR